MPAMQHVVYAKSSQVPTATSCCLLFIAMDRIKLSMTRLSISLKRFSIKLMWQLNKNSVRYAWNVTYCLRARVYNCKSLPCSLLQPFIVYYLAPCL